MRVLHVAASMAPEWGGPVQTVAALTGELLRLGISVEVATTTGRRVGSEAVRVPGVPVHRFPTGFGARFWTAHSPGLRRFLDRELGRFDLVHVHELWHHAAFAAHRAARRRDLPVVQALHGALDEWRLRRKRIRKSVFGALIGNRDLRSAAAIHTLVREEEEQVVRRLGYEPRFLRAPNGVALDDLTPTADPESSDLLREFPELGRRPVVLFLGRLHRMKGLDVLARSFAQVAARFDEVLLLVAGPDEDGTSARMVEILREAGVLGRVVRPGLLTGEDRLAAFGCADLFVLPSYSEGFSAAVLEALGAGLPVVISRRCNFPEVESHRAGFVVEAEDAAVAGAIGALLDDEERRKEMGRNGRELVRTRYAWGTVAARVADGYRALVEGRSRPDSGDPAASGR